MSWEAPTKTMKTTRTTKKDMLVVETLVASSVRRAETWKRFEEGG
jgi:hypothetical protein